MKTADLRTELHHFIDKADERVLRLIYGLMKADQEESEEDYDLSESHQEILDKRLMLHESNPMEGSSWETVKQRVKKKK